MALLDLRNRLKMLRSYGLSNIKKTICEHAQVSTETLRLVLNGKVQNDNVLACAIAVIEHYEDKREADIRRNANQVKLKLRLEYERLKFMNDANETTPSESEWLETILLNRIQNK